MRLSATKIFLPSLLTVLTACSLGIPGTVAAATPDHSSLDLILRANVREERVDYLMIRKNHFKQLSEYLDRLAAIDPATLSRNEQLALYINLYNASMIKTVCERFRDRYSVAESNFAVFEEPLVRTGGTTISLNHLENKVVRPTFKEPRIHTALVCGAVSCPPLLPRAYLATDLDSVLEANMYRFINDQMRNTANATEQTLKLSQIFNWYADDFGGAGKIAAYVQRYHPEEVSKYTVSFLDYSWDLNFFPPASGRWVMISPEQADLRSAPVKGEVVATATKGEVFECLEEQTGWLRVSRPFAEPVWIATAQTESYAGGPP